MQKNDIKVTVLIVWLMAAGLGNAQSTSSEIDAVLDPLDRREQYLVDKEFVWRVSHTVVSDRTPAASNSNVPQYAAQEKAIRASLNYEVVVTRTRDRVVVQGKGVVMNLQKGTAFLVPYVAIFDNGWSAELTYDPDTQKPRSLEVTASGADSWKHVNASRVVYDLMPEHFTFLCGMSPRELHGLRWTIAQKQRNTTVLAAYPRKDASGDQWMVSSAEDLEKFGLDPNTLFEMEVSNSRTIHSLRFYSGFESLPTNLPSNPEDALKIVLQSPRRLNRKIQVAKITSIDGHDFPQTLSEERFVPSYRKITWQLLEVRDVHENSNDLNKLIPQGTTVFDYRHCGAGHNTKPPGCTPVKYEWRGKLLSLDELRKRAEANTSQPPARKFNWVVWVLPAALIVAGVLWFLRLRVSHDRT